MQPGSRRELAGASQLSCPHSDSRILSAQAGRRDKELREACGGLLGPWSFSEVAALGGGLLPVPQPSEWSRDHCLHGQAGRALAGVVGRMSLSAPARRQPPPGDLGRARPGPGLAFFLWDCWARLLEGHEATPTRPGKYKLQACRTWGWGAGHIPGSLVLEARVAAFVPACSWPPSHHGHSLPISLEALPKAWSCFLECLPTNILILLVGPGGAFGTEETLLWLCQVSCSQPAGPSNRSHLGPSGPSDPGGPPCQARWTHAPPEGFPEGMTH